MNKETCLEIAHSIKNLATDSDNCSEISSQTNGIVYDRNNYTNFHSSFKYVKNDNNFKSEYLNMFSIEFNDIKTDRKKKVNIEDVKSMLSKLKNKDTESITIKSIDFLIDKGFYISDVKFNTLKDTFFIYLNQDKLKAYFSIDANFIN